MSDPSFWENGDHAKEISQKATEAKAAYDTYTRLFARAESIKELLDMAIEENDQDMEGELEEEINELKDILDKKEIELLLNDEYDANDAIITFHAGAGGTEAQDWTEMLIRMYIKWAESEGFVLEELNMLPGDEAGVKSGDDIEIDLNMADVRVDYYRASGAGGQHINKTSSAVRMTHIPTGIVAACQNERSQFQNKEQCLRLLKAKLFELEMQKREQVKKGIEGEQQAIEWGSQIRSYVFQPYTLVKDNRTGIETGNIQSVMDGGLNPFIEGFLKHKKFNNA